MSCHQFQQETPSSPLSTSAHTCPPKHLFCFIWRIQPYIAPNTATVVLSDKRSDNDMYKTRSFCEHRTINILIIMIYVFRKYFPSTWARNLFWSTLPPPQSAVPMVHACRASQCVVDGFTIIPPVGVPLKRTLLKCTRSCGIELEELNCGGPQGKLWQRNRQLHSTALRQSKNEKKNKWKSRK